MERQPRNYEDLSGGEVTHPDGLARRIYDGLEEARRTGRRIDDLTAKRIAQAIDPGDGPLHEFVGTGAIPDDMEVQLGVAEEVIEDLEMKSHVPWLGALREYFDGRLLRSAMPYWNDPSME